MNYKSAIKNLETGKNISKVKEFLKECSEAYYNTDSVIITDIQYDELYRKYVEITGDEFIGAEPSNTKGTISVSHGYKNLVGTLRKAKNLDEVDEYLDKLFKVKLNEYRIRLSLKFDGNSVTIEYDENGNVEKALTRGKNGKGKDLTNVFKDFKKESLFYESGPYAIKYEAIITYDNYNKLCEKFDEDYANPRSLISGILGGDDAYKYRDFITLVPIEMRVKNDGEFVCFENGIKKLYDDEPVFHDNNNYYSKYETHITIRNKKEAKEEIERYYNYVNSIRTELPFMIDGIVVDFIDEKVISTYFYDPRGFIPEHSFAVKLPYLEAIGIVQDIDFCVGNSGRITPRVWFTGEDGKPIKFNGTEHTKQQISNYKRFNNLNIGKGSKVLISYNNDCLSYITKMEIPENEKIEPFEFCECCPSCGGDVFIIENDKGEETLAKCENPECPSRIIGKIENYLIGLDIKGLKDNSIVKMYEDKVIDDIASLYKIDEKKAIKSIGKNAIKIIQAINEKIPYDYEILGSLSIEQIGLESAKVVCKKYSVSELLEMSENESSFKKTIKKIEGYGDIMTKLLLNGIKENYELIEELLEITKCKIYKEEFKDVGEGQKFVFTGFRNKSWELQLERLGHKVTSSVSRKTSIVVYGDEPGAIKMNKAKELGIPTMYMMEFKEKFNLM